MFRYNILKKRNLGILLTFAVNKHKGVALTTTSRQFKKGDSFERDSGNFPIHHRRRMAQRDW
jgi:hypothetical protein